MDQALKDEAWAKKMSFARQLAGHYGRVIRVSARIWELSDGARIWEYTLKLTDEPLWSRERNAAHHHGQTRHPAP